MMSTSRIDLSTLPDLPSLQKLAQSLWGRNTERKGVALMIGSGFSRCAAHSVNMHYTSMPVWGDMINQIIEALGYQQTDSDKPGDPLRLAEEYCTLFGQQALNTFIIEQIKDDRMEPGQLYERLLALPWAEVLTTNWDTLLERAAKHINTPVYDTVSQVTDLTNSYSPRIVKLHGTIGISNHFIFTEEDFRTYPQRYAAFVNFARQTFIENDLCLLGFSGDDPNFLQWTGWIRDNLKQYARRIYYVTASPLRPVKRQLLNQRGITTIDLNPLVKDLDKSLRYEQTYTKLFDYLKQQKPVALHAWQPLGKREINEPSVIKGSEHNEQTANNPNATSSLENNIRDLKANRLDYPLWVICPAKLRTQLADLPNSRTQNLEQMPEKERALFLYELIWRKNTALQPINAYLLPFLEAFADPAQSCALTLTQQLDFCITLLRCSRKAEDTETFNHWAEIIQKHAEHFPEYLTHLAYQRCLLARDQLAPEEIKQYIEDIQGEDPLWLVRKAAMHNELNEFSQAKILIEQAYKTLEIKKRQDNQSLAIRSRFAWVHWLLPHIQPDSTFSRFRQSWPLEYQETLCDPIQELEKLNNEFNKLLQESTTLTDIILSFSPGWYAPPKPANSIDELKTLNYQLESIAEIIGLPSYYEIGKIFTYRVISHLEKYCLACCYTPSLSWFSTLIRTVSSPEDELITRYLSRISIATIPDDFIRLLNQKIKARINDPHYSSTRRAICIEILARLTPRLSAAEAKEHLTLALKTLKHPEPLIHGFEKSAYENLFQHSLDSLSSAQQREFILPAIAEFSLPADDMSKGIIYRWPDFTDYFNSYDLQQDRTKHSSRWSAAIDSLIQAYSRETLPKELSLRRLLFLHECNVLTPQEQKRLATIIWRDNDIQPSTFSTDRLGRLYSCSILALPSPETINKQEVFQHIYTKLPGTELINSSDLLHSLSNAGRYDPPCYLNENKAIHYFKALCSFCLATPPVPDPYDDPWFPRKSKLHVIGQVLSYAIVPALSLNKRTASRFKQLLALIRDQNIFSALPALIYFPEPHHNQIIQQLQQSMRSQILDEANYATIAIRSWIEQPGANIPNALISMVMGSITYGTNQAISFNLMCAYTLLQTNRLAEEEIRVLEQTLPNLMQMFDYQHTDSLGIGAVITPLIRADCVRIAVWLIHHQHNSAALQALVKAAETDPLPEVRFALEIAKE